MRERTDDEQDAAAEAFYQDQEDPYCYRCDNKGLILTCIDDMCRGCGECMHGDGWAVCPDCKGASGDF
jgi:hypothetical protein